MVFFESTYSYLCWTFGEGVKGIEVKKRRKSNHISGVQTDCNHQLLLPMSHHVRGRHWGDVVRCGAFCPQTLGQICCIYCKSWPY